MRTHYDVLGVSPHADQATIRRAYLRLIRVAHPDRHQGSHDQFLEVRTAYETLRDPTLRGLYDMQRCKVSRPQRRGDDLFDHLEVPLPLAVRGGPLRHGGLTLTIPAGTLAGDRLRLAGRGGPGRPRGDLVLEVELLPHPRWRLDGLDLHTVLPVTWLEAYRGGVVRLRTPWREVDVPLEPGACDGHVIQIEGDGLRRDEERGDLFAVLHLQAPPAGDVALTGVLCRLQGLGRPREQLEADFA